jgi:hypothetical protein
MVLFANVLCAWMKSWEYFCSLEYLMWNSSCRGKTVALCLQIILSHVTKWNKINIITLKWVCAGNVGAVSTSSLLIPNLTL